MKNLYLLLTFCLFSAAVAHAQHVPGNITGGGTGVNVTDHMLMMDARKAMSGPSEEKIEGTPYLTEEFLTADVYSNKGKYPATPMRYNIFADYIEFKHKDITYILDAGPDIKKVDFGNFSLVVEKTEVKGKMKSGYFALLDSGKVTLLSKKVVTYREAQPPKALETTGKPARYSRSGDDYLYKVGNGPVMDVGSVKKMIESFPDKQEELKQFASQEKISKNEKDLVKLVKYYNSL